MLLNSLKISGWRSFAPDHPVATTELKIVNLIIGPNNVGKSNLGRFLVRLRNILRERGFHKTSPWSDSGAYYTPLCLQFKIDEIDHWLRKKDVISAEIEINVSALAAPKKFPDFLMINGCVKFKIEMKVSNGDGFLSITPFTGGDKSIIRRVDNTYSILVENNSYTEQVLSDTHWYRGIALAACQCLSICLIEIKPLRDPTRKALEKIETSTDGGEIIEALLDAQHDTNRQDFWTNCKFDLESWFAVLLAEAKVRIDINEKGFWIETERAERPFRCELRDLGAGVSELVMVLAYLRLCPERPLFIIIDEPEAHLHPGAVVELVRIINAHLPNHQLLITTHSTALIDAITPEWRSYRAGRAKHGGTTLELINTTKIELALLSDLGIRPSQMFLAKVVVWVEGPSDIHYLIALIREVNEKMVFGRDFAFVTYGGASSAHLGICEDEDEQDQEGSNATNYLVQLLKVAHRSVVVCDRDRNANEPNRALITRLINAANLVPAHARIETSLGREIENGVKQDVLLRILEEIRPKRFNKPPINLTYLNYEIGPDDAFDKVISEAARRTDGIELTKVQRDTIKTRLDQGKNEIASRVQLVGLEESVFVDEAVKKGKELVEWMLTDPKS